MELLIQDPVDAAPGARPEGPVDRPRPVLTVIQGGAPRRKRNRLSRSVPPPAAPAPDDQQQMAVEEVPIYLRPIPPWVPRLW
ncbi:MAG: hypothetical protein HY002_00745 [Candidatus Rokubacteria bacterium]|nr:hypothetical protein [Candidatus Rokubacteria bacterium]